MRSAELIPHTGSDFRFVYRTTGQSDVPVISGGMVCVPEGKPPQGGWPVVSWGHGTSGVTEGCTPSRNNGAGGPVDTLGFLSHTLR
ncbi:hypothetical protein IU427_23445 [Nocardia beijingensis]|uniref:hypothetical protein n=1 Tax=Nocardia beijingensis TaxID=95162 RepID=UPI0018954C2D|nr:hypothetical protein [Nocardia beijingensis]MBF6468124.1 hypothetical protein [Nocardia beijingensis]